MSAKYLTEAFGALELLNEDTFDITTNGVEGLQDFIASDDNVMDDFEAIIDPLAETEEELQDSYIGKAILDCSVCHSKIYKDPKEVELNEDETLANVGEICPYCQSSDGYKVIGQVAEFCPHCEEKEIESEDDDDDDDDAIEESKRSLDDIDADMDDKKEIATNLKEDINNISIETDKEKITVSAESKDCDCEEKKEMIEPVTEETKDEFKTEDDYEDIDVDEFDENEFDELGEGYLKRVYENVKGYKTTGGSINGNKLKLEGVITFKSGKQGKTNFIFESASVSKTGKVKFIGENKQFAKGKKSFILTGKMDGNKLIAESLTYNYKGKDSKTNTSKRLYGRICK